MDKCCLNIIIRLELGDITLPVISNYDINGVFINYTFIYIDLYTISYNELTSAWEMYDGLTLIAFYNTSNSYCPEAPEDDWDIVLGRFKFILYAKECNPNNNDIPADVDPINCDVPCTNGNLLKKQKASLSNDIADISKREVFGLKCNDNWENIFMRSLIIDALSCLPYGFYSKDEEQCLIGNLTDKCNC